MSTRELIETAFADVPYPGDNNIADHEDCLECDDVRAFFRGKSWRDLKFPELHDFHESLSHFTGPAFLYFLPGYMIACLDDWNLSDMIPYSVIRIGGYGDDTEAAKSEARENRQVFTRNQREAIAAWLVDLSNFGGVPWEPNDPQVDYAVDRILND